jgi:hypothetical protein
MGVLYTVLNLDLHCAGDLYVSTPYRVCIAVYNLQQALTPIISSTVNPAQSNTTPFLNVPIPSITTSICVPGTRYFGGERPAPTPNKTSQLN